MSDLLFWILFFVFFCAVSPLLFRRMTVTAWVVWLVIIYYLQTIIHIEFPPVVYWILFVLLLPGLLIPWSIGFTLFWMTVLTPLHPYDRAIDQIQLMSPIIYWFLFVGILGVPMLYKRAFVGFAVWTSIAIILRDNIHPQMTLGWFVAWIWLLSVLGAMFPPEMPLIWPVFWVPIITGLGFAIHPDWSKDRFVLWTLAIFGTRFILYFVYTLYYIFPERYIIFPFNIFSQRWKRSEPKWQSVVSTERSPLLGRTVDNAILCKRCEGFTASSKLIMGSEFPFTRLEEWYDEVWGSLEELKRLAVPGDASHGLPCHLCHLFWSSTKRSFESEQAVMDNVRPHNQESGSRSGVTAKPQVTGTDKLHVKIWEERPLSLYTYAQLFHGDHNTPIGARLLIHRGKLFEKLSPACESKKTKSYRHIEQAKLWLKNCKKHHKLCHGVGNTPKKLPTRLIHVASTPNSSKLTLTLKIVDQETDRRKLKYLAFSHCWGSTGSPNNPAFTLSTTNYESSLKEGGFKYSKLSKNIRQAVKITQSLGFSYIWIDSLCIIQDSTKDWKAESAKMGDVYSGAACTIASTGATSGNEGCFHDRNPLSLQPCIIGVSPPEDHQNWIYIRRDDVFDFERSIDRAPLNKRAWVLQERLLSRCILHFGAELMYWECCRRSASELNPNGYIYKKYLDGFNDSYYPSIFGVTTRAELEHTERENRGITWSANEALRECPPPAHFDPDGPLSSHTIWQRKRGFWKDVRKPSATSWKDDEKESEKNGSGFRAAFEKLQNNKFEKDELVGMNSFSHCWYEIVEAYTRGNLTYSKDKLVALSGVVKDIEKATNYTYLAGLWEQHLLTELLWFTAEVPGRRILEEDSPLAKPTEGHSFNPGTQMAPTWSWASLEGTVALDINPETPSTEIEVKEILIKRLSATVKPVPALAGLKDKFRLAQSGNLVIEGPLCKISNIEYDGTMWFIEFSRGYRAARLFPDVSSDIDVVSKNIDATELFCMPCLVLRRETTRFLMKSKKEEIQGLVFRRRDKKGGVEPDVFERLGFFTTSRMNNVFSSQKRLRTADTQLIHVK